MAHNKPLTKYSPKTSNQFAKDLTVFVGLVVQGVLDVDVLESAAHELVHQWPMLGGTLIRTVSPARRLITSAWKCGGSSLGSRRTPSLSKAATQLISRLEQSTKPCERISQSTSTSISQTPQYIRRSRKGTMQMNVSISNPSDHSTYYRRTYSRSESPV